jgi:NAD(P)-dependent dehydrogenase (short-subunit alcohol dehydrogenase family)
MAERTVLLIGATQGLGLAFAERYLREGWRVIATTVHPSPALDSLAALHPGRIAIHPLDINDRDAVKALKAELGDVRLDLLHNLAGVLPEDKPIWDYDDAEILRILHTNAISGITLAAQMEPLLNPDGTFAFTSSGMGSIGRNRNGNTDLYRLSKAALNMMARSFAAKHAQGRNILLLCPGWAKTEMGGPLATVEVEDSVSGLYAIIADPQPQPDGPVFRDYTGAAVPW